MLFWVLYLHVLGLGVCFFIWSVVRYLGWRRTLSDRTWFRARDELDPVLISLQAQFLVAPRLALLEARSLLDDRQGHSEATITTASKELAAEFGNVLARLAGGHMLARRAGRASEGRPARNGETRI